MIPLGRYSAWVRGSGRVSRVESSRGESRRVESRSYRRGTPASDLVGRWGRRQRRRREPSGSDCLSSLNARGKEQVGRLLTPRRKAGEIPNPVTVNNVDRPAFHQERRLLDTSCKMSLDSGSGPKPYRMNGAYHHDARSSGDARASTSPPRLKAYLYTSPSAISIPRSVPFRHL